MLHLKFNSIQFILLICPTNNSNLIFQIFSILYYLYIKLSIFFRISNLSSTDRIQISLNRQSHMNHMLPQITVEFVYSEVQGTLSQFVIGIVRYKRNNVELPPLLKIVLQNFAGSNSKGLSKSVLAIGSSSHRGRVILERNLVLTRAVSLRYDN